MLIDIDLYAGLTSIEVQEYFCAMLKAARQLKDFRCCSAAAHRHCFWVPLPVVTVEELEHVILEPLAVFVYSFSCLFASFDVLNFLRHASQST